MTAILCCTCHLPVEWLSCSLIIMSMFIFIPGLPQRIAMIPDPDDQSAQP
jgi:hypothetical protein